MKKQTNNQYKCANSPKMQFDCCDDGAVEEKNLRSRTPHPYYLFSSFVFSLMSPLNPADVHPFLVFELSQTPRL